MNSIFLIWPLISSARLANLSVLFAIVPNLTTFQCGDMFSTKASLSVHNERRHGIKVAKKKCFVCAEILNAQDVKQHILNAHPGALPEDDAGRQEQKVEEEEAPGKWSVCVSLRLSFCLSVCMYVDVYEFLIEIRSISKGVRGVPCPTIALFP